MVPTPLTGAPAYGMAPALAEILKKIQETQRT